MLGVGIGFATGFVIIGLLIGISTMLYSKKVPILTCVLISVIPLIIAFQVITSIVFGDESIKKNVKISFYKKIVFSISYFPMIVEDSCTCIAEILVKTLAAKPTTRVQCRSVVNKWPIIANSALKNLEQSNFA